jgi:TolB-like protein/Tfp pilus assembly protein PilF
MKRCPQCNRVESDEALKFCRVDGATLISDSSSFSAEAGTAQLGGSPDADEVHTSILPHHTKSNVNRATAPTTVLSSPVAASTTGQLTKTKRKKAVIVAAFIAVIGAAAILIGGSFYLSRNRSSTIQSIAVMPFVNESGVADVEYLSDGMTDTLISSLSQLPNLNVKAHASVFRYKGKEQNLKTIGKELNVQAILNGRFAQRGDRLTLTLELVDALTENVIWSEQYDRKQAELVSLQSEVAHDVSAKLRTKLSGAEEQKLTKSYTTNPEAYQLYLKGLFYWNQRTGESLKQSVEYFNQAIEKDPNYALAYAGLADAYQLIPAYQAGSPSEYSVKAKAAATRALEIDDTLAEAHAALGVVLWGWDWSYAEANREFQRAIELNPNYATAHQWYGENLGQLGRFDEAIAEFKRAQELDPLSLIINADFGEVYTWARQYDKAIEVLRKTTEMDQRFYYAHRQLGMAFELKGSYQEAIAEYQKARAQNDDPIVLAFLGHAYANSGKHDEALKLLDQLKEMSKQRYVGEYNFAVLYAALGQRDQAFQWLEKAYQDRASHLNWIKVDPMLDNLRSDPRFADLVRRVGL